jgi:polar amino acid transport system substrate-binding protein
MTTAERTDHIIIAVLVALVLGFSGWQLFGPGNKDSASSQAEQVPSEVSYTDYDGKRAGIITGSFQDSLIVEHLPHCAIYNYDTMTGLIEALRTDKIDFFIGSNEQRASILSENPDLAVVEEPIDQFGMGVMLPQTEQGAALKAQWDEFLGKLRADGTLDEILDYWANDPEALSTPVDTSGLTGENGTLRFATTGTNTPTSFQVGDAIAGSEPELALRFCREYGYDIEVELVNFSGIIPGLATGVYDFALANAVITEERLESLYFSEPYKYLDCHLVVLGSSTQEVSEEGGGFFVRLAKSFEKNFIREDRWQLILQGVGVTCLITVLSVAFGSLLAFGICLFRRTGSRLAKLISNLYVKVLQGTPTVVLLMMLYYVCFARTGLAAVWVAVIGFTLNFGAYASEIMRSGIESVSPGQREAALALGYSEREAFYDFIFPQAAVSFLPVLRGEMISLLKSTSVVGYISILDLTKTSDIIRSRTYEAFFPLIVTALIYFALSWVIAKLMELLLARVDTRRRARKGEGASE